MDGKKSDFIFIYFICFHSFSKSKFVCMRIFKRAKQIIEIIYGNQVNHMNEACLYFEPQNFDITYHTLTCKFFSLKFEIYLFNCSL